MTFHKVTSRSNPRLKALRRHLKAGFGTTAFVVEGEKLIKEALLAGLQPSSVWAVEPPSFDYSGQVFLVPKAVYSSISPTKNGQPPLAEFSHAGLESLPSGFALKGTWLLLDQIQDPGNAGTLVRAARAFGLAGVLWHLPTVFPFHHACIRASGGAVFHLKHRTVNAEAIASCPLPLVIAALEGSSLEAFSWPRELVLAMGNEGHGFSDAVVGRADSQVNIPIHPQTESLNVAGAGHILMYHLSQHQKP